MKKVIVIIFSFLIILAVAAALFFYFGSDSEPDKPKGEVPVNITDGFSKQCWDTGDQRLPYWLYVPDKLTENMPLIVVLHCSYRKIDPALTESENLDRMVVSDPDKKDIPAFIYNGEFGEIPAYVIMPQTDVSSRGWLRRGQELVDLINGFKNEYSIDSDRISLIGYSLGATGALELASEYPETFKRVLSVAGGLDGVTNNTIPYIPGQGRLILDDAHYPELRVPSDGDSTAYETEMMKYLYAPAESRFLAVSEAEISVANRFRGERIEKVSKNLRENGTEVWMLAASNDAEVEPSVSKDIYLAADSENVRCDIIDECGHSRILTVCLEMHDDVLEFLTK